MPLGSAEEGVERFVEFGADDLATVDHEPGDERLVEQGAYHFGILGLRVQLSRVVQQCQRLVEDPAADVELGMSVGQAALDAIPLGSDGADLLAQLLLGPPLLGGQVEQVALLLVECVETAGVLVAELVGERERLGYGGVDHLPQFGAEGFG